MTNSPDKSFKPTPLRDGPITVLQAVDGSLYTIGHCFLSLPFLELTCRLK